MIWHLRHVETKRNVADEPLCNFNRGEKSRFDSSPVVTPDPCSGLSAEPSQSSKQVRFGEVIKNPVPHSLLAQADLVRPSLRVELRCWSLSRSSTTPLLTFVGDRLNY